MPARVLMLSWEYPPLIEGGLARHADKLSRELAAAGHRVHVLTRGRPAGPAEEGPGLVVHRVDEGPHPSDLDAFLAWVARMNRDMVRAGGPLADAGAFDVVHGHDWLVAPAGDALARRARRPLVSTVHATEHGRHQGWVRTHPQCVIHAAECRMVTRADRVITCSEFMRRHLSRALGAQRERVTVIPNGVDPGDLRDGGDPAALRARLAPGGEPLVLLAGRLVYEKGFQLALDALPGVIRRLGGARFVVAGSGTHEAQLRAQAAGLGLDAHGEFLGWVDDALLRSLYRVADACVIPSIYEPFGLVALEAMAAGCPCVVADTGGLREIVPHGEAGLRFRPRSAGALGRALERMLTDGELRTRLVSGAAEHVRRYDWGEVARLTAGVYARVARPPAPRRAAAAAVR